MAKSSKSLASMTVDALLKLRDDIGAALSHRATDLKRQLSRLGGGERASSGRKRRGALKGRKVEPKYRGPNGETWAGRGATPRWLAEVIKGGAKKDDFLIAMPGAATRKKSTTKTSGRKKKA